MKGGSEPILLSVEALSEEGNSKGKGLIVTSVFFSDKQYCTAVEAKLTTILLSVLII
jgi:hypothetical protein